MPPLPSKDQLLSVHNRYTSTTVPHDLFNLYVISRNSLFGAFLPRKIIAILLTKNSRKFQARVTERSTSLSKRSGMFQQNLLKVP